MTTETSPAQSAKGQAPAAPAAPVAASDVVPYAHTRLPDTERELLREVLYEVGTDPEQKFILGRRTAELERRLADRADVRDVVACASGTGALTLALRAVGVVPGDEVIVPAFGAEPLAATVLGVGAVPVFADVDPVTMVLDPVDAESRVTDRTRAVVPAHTFTTMADMPAIRSFARRRGIAVVEDAAVGQGATLGGRAAGAWGTSGSTRSSRSSRSECRAKARSSSPTTPNSPHGCGGCATTGRTACSASCTTRSASTAASTRSWPASSSAGWSAPTP